MDPVLLYLEFKQRIDLKRQDTKPQHRPMFRYASFYFFAGQIISIQPHLRNREPRQLSQDEIDRAKNMERKASYRLILTNNLSFLLSGKSNEGKGGARKSSY